MVAAAGGSVYAPKASSASKRTRRSAMTPAGRERAIKSLSRDQGAVVENLEHKIQRQMHDEHSRQIDVFHQMDVDGSGQLDAHGGDLFRELLVG